MSLGYYLLSMIDDYNSSPFVVNSESKLVLLSIKKKNDLNMLCNNPKRKMIKGYLEEVLSYGYKDKPYYAKLKHLLVAELLKIDKIPNPNVFGIQNGPQ